MNIHVDYFGAYSKIKGLIATNGLKQRDIAQALGIDETVLSKKLNRNSGADLSFSEAITLADILGTDISNFF